MRLISRINVCIEPWAFQASSHRKYTKLAITINSQGKETRIEQIFYPQDDMKSNFDEWFDHSIKIMKGQMKQQLTKEASNGKEND